MGCLQRYPNFNIAVCWYISFSHVDNCLLPEQLWTWKLLWSTEKLIFQFTESNYKLYVFFLLLNEKIVIYLSITCCACTLLCCIGQRDVNIWKFQFYFSFLKLMLQNSYFLIVFFIGIFIIGHKGNVFDHIFSTTI